MADIRELKFINIDARPKEQLLHVDAASVAPIMAWYGAYYAGDRYSVMLDGKRLQKGQNGELTQQIQESCDEGPNADATEEIKRLRNALGLATERGCNHCSKSIRAARAALTSPTSLHQ